MGANRRGFINYGRAGSLIETYGTEIPIHERLAQIEPDIHMYLHQICVGTVHQVIHGTYAYRIAFEGFQSPIVCTSLSPNSVFQSVPSYTYPVGSRVEVLLNQDATWGIILGAVPIPYTQSGAEDAAKTANFISGIGSYHYFWPEYTKHFLENRPLSYGLWDYAYRRMVDNLQGDYTISNVFGGGFHTDPFMIYIRQSHSCGVWMFMVDQLLRLMGRSIQEYSIVHERYAGVDEAESYLFEGAALYLHEGYGFLLPDEAKTHTLNDPSSLLREKGIGFGEPTTMEPFYRQQMFSGFVGQGKIRLYFIPPKSKDLEEHPIAVSKQHTLKDGTLLFESAREIHLIKHGNIRSFKRIRAIEDPQGDDLAKENYRFSKLLDLGPLPNGATITDRIIYASRRLSGAGFEAHKLDFEKIPEEQRVFEQDVELGSLSTLKTAPLIPVPPEQKLYVDEQNETEYHGTRAGVSILPAGDVVIRGSCGEEVLLQGGNITFSAPGDVRFFFGRSAVVTAGDDIVLRAKNSVDITATDHDVRLKAERNLDMVGGMAGIGRTLLENKARGYPFIEGALGREGEHITGGGVVLKAEESVVSSYGRRIYTRSLNGGEIFLDADEGKGSLKAQAVYIGMDGSSNIVLGVGHGNNLLQMTRGSTLLTQRLEVEGQILSSRRVLADQGCNRDPLSEPNFNEERMEWIDAAKESFMSSVIVGQQERYYDNQGMGSKEFIDAYTFSYRTSDQCGANRFSFDEPYWMELYGQMVVTTFATWEEPVYTYQGTHNQTAWPGYSKWVEDKCVEVGKSRLYDAETGRDLDTGSLDTATQLMTPAEFYRIMDPT